MSFLMMNQKSPGVYVNEAPSGAMPIVGVGTNTTAALLQLSPLLALSVTADQQTIAYEDGGGLVPGVPTLVTSFTELRDAVCGAYRTRLRAALAALDQQQRPAEDPAREALGVGLAALDAAVGPLFTAMYGFFLNGGTRCYVVLYETLTADLFETLETLDDISIVIAPGLAPPPYPKDPADLAAADTSAYEAWKAQVTAITGHCEKMGDRMAILDGPNGEVDIHEYDFPASTHAALYYPFIAAIDPLGGPPRACPPSAHVAGVWARVDATRGVHKAPANIEIRGAIGVAAVVSRNEQDGMNPRGINAIRKLQGSVLIYGARTLGAANGEARFINVQRTLAYIAQSIDQGIRWVVFEPNTPALWGKVCRNINAFLHGLWASGALFGATPEQAWYVQCDERLNPPDERDKGHLKLEIGVALVKPAEFVVINLTQWSGPSR